MNNSNDDDEQPPVTKRARRGELKDHEDKDELVTKEEKKQDAEDETNSAAIDTTAVHKIWSPQRASRVGLKVRSLQDGNLCGGDVILDTDGSACTISFLFEKDDKVYGLTAGHLADVCDNLEIFAESQADEEGNYPTIDVGQVVSKDVQTDSLIFQINHPHVLQRVDLLMLSPKSGLSILRLPEPDANPTPPQEGTEVVVYGTKRRGANGVVVIGRSEFKGKISKKGDIGISSKDDSGNSVSCGSTSLTDDGDCGALYLVTTSGSPIAMHHCLQNPQDGGKNTDKTKGYISFGIPLAKILSKHTLLGGHLKEGAQEQQLHSPPAATGKQTRNMAIFKTKPSTKIPMMKGTIQRPRQSRNIAKVKTRRIFIDRNGKRV